MIGQARLLREVEILEQEIRSGKPLTLLLTAPPGYGKTTLGLKIIQETVGLNNAQLSGPPDFVVSRKKQINFLDEIHLLEDQELLYPLVDSGRTTFIFATNESGMIKEPLLTRCIQLVFDSYTIDEISEIVRKHLPDVRNEAVVHGIAQRTKLNPRITVQLCRRLAMLFKYGIPNTEEELDAIISYYLDITREGLTTQDRRYLQALEGSGGRASIDLICSLTGYTRATVLRDIEPGLIHLGKVEITSRGRILK